MFQKHLDDSEVMPSEEQKSQDSITEEKLSDKSESKMNEEEQDSDSEYVTISEESLESPTNEKPEALPYYLPP